MQDPTNSREEVEDMEETHQLSEFSKRMEALVKKSEIVEETFRRRMSTCEGDLPRKNSSPNNNYYRRSRSISEGDTPLHHSNFPITPPSPLSSILSQSPTGFHQLRRDSLKKALDLVDFGSAVK